MSRHRNCVALTPVLWVMKSLGIIAGRVMSVVTALFGVYYLGQLPYLVAIARSTETSVPQAVIQSICLAGLFGGFAIWLWNRADSFAGPDAAPSTSADAVTIDEVRRLAFAMVGAFFALGSIGTLMHGAIQNYTMGGPTSSFLRAFVSYQGLPDLIMLAIGTLIYILNRPRARRGIKNSLNWPRNADQPEAEPDATLNA
jgi:hypothetical protein